jgi:hypothetical protein
VGRKSIPDEARKNLMFVLDELWKKIKFHLLSKSQQIIYLSLTFDLFIA